MAKTHDPVAAFGTLSNNTVAVIKEFFPFKGLKQELHLEKIWVDDKLDVDDVQAQRDLKDRGGTWGVPIRADVVLKDSSGKVIDRKAGMILGRLPKTTPRNSYLVGGNEYQVDTLFRLKPGVFSRLQMNGELETEFNTTKTPTGKSLSVHLDPAKAALNLQLDTKKIPLYPILKAAGAADADIEHAWGKDLYQTNLMKDPQRQEKALKDFWERTSEEGAVEPKTFADLQKHAKTFFENSKLRPDTTKLTLGKPFEFITGEALTLAARNIALISRGERKPDDRDSLVFKEVVGIEDFVPQRIERNAKLIKSRVRQNIDHKKSIGDFFSSDIFGKHIEETFTKTSVSERAEQTNPIAMMSGADKTTLVSKDFGGLKNERSLIKSMQIINPASIGFLDPAHTPEGERTGITLHLASGARKEGKTLVLDAWSRKDGKTKTFNISEFNGLTAAFPDQVKWVNGHPVPLSKEVQVKLPNGDISKVPFDRVDVVMPSAKAMYDSTTNQVPFLSSNNGNRVSMANKQMEQTISLKERERPLVQTATDAGHSYAAEVGAASSHAAKVAGKVIEVSPSRIVIQQGKEKVTHHLYDHFALNTPKAMMHSDPVVKVGDTVKKGQLIADTNFTKDGELALGKNLHVGYMPYKGYNFEDGIVISETAAKKMTSEHLHIIELEVEQGSTLVGPRQFKMSSPVTAQKFTKDHEAALDGEGVIRVGQKVVPGQILIPAVRRNIAPPPGMRGGYGKREYKPFSNASATWDSDHHGEVVRVVKDPSGKSIKVFVKTEEPLIVGDKLAGRYGNKGIVSLIVPDHEMPFTKGADGEKKPLEILLNPSGLPTRMNIGQVYETMMSKVADKLGKPVIMENLKGNGHDYHAEVTAALKQHGIPDTEHVFSPDAPNQPLDQKVMVGKQFIHKLVHQVEKKLSTRGGGTDLAGKPYPDDLNRQPSKGSGNGGQSVGALDMYALLGHGARANIREMATYKSDAQDQAFWDRIQMGGEPPPPQPSFAYKKFDAMLKALGVNTVKVGTSLRVQPLTDLEVLRLADNGKNEITHPHLAIRAKDGREEKGGLFDPSTTGGLSGSRWGYIKLNEPMPNPIFVGENNHPGPIPVLLGLHMDNKGNNDVDLIMAGKKELHGKTGGRAILEALKKVDVDKEIESAKTSLNNLSGAPLDRANRKLKMLLALKETGHKPHEAYMMGVLPVLPPQFRPATMGQDGNIQLPSIGKLYKNIGLLNNAMHGFDKSGAFEEHEKHEIRQQAWDSIKALQSVGNYSNVYELDARNTGNEKRKLRGILDTLGSGEGQQPKDAFIQAALVKRKQNLALRSTIIPEPKLGIDEVGLPKSAAMELYKPFVVAHMTKQGATPLQAQQYMRDMHPLAMTALQAVTQKRPLLLKRDPSLHKFSVMAFTPRLVEGKAIQIHPLITGAFNADFDGDQQVGTALLALQQGLGAFLTQFGQNDTHGICIQYQDRSWWEMRKVGTEMTARFREMVSGFDQNGDLFLVNLEDFPHFDEHHTKDHVDFHKVPDGVCAISYNEETKTFSMAPVSYWSVHHDRAVELVNLRSGRQIITDDDPRAVYGLDKKLLPVRSRPSDSVGMFVPYAHELDFEGKQPVVLPLVQHEPRAREDITTNHDLGYLLGALAGDGWVVTADGRLKGQVALAAADAGVCTRYNHSLLSFFKEMPVISAYERIGGDFGPDVVSARYVVSSMGFSKFVFPLIGKTAQKKHLPPFFLQSPREFRMGLLAGLMDTDGSISVSHGKSKPQWMLNMTSTSLRLVQELQLLLRSLKIRSTITDSETPAKNPCWVINISTVDFHKLRHLDVGHTEKVERFAQFFAGEAPSSKNSYSQIDIIPTPAELAVKLRAMVGQRFGNSLYSILSQAQTKGYISRISAVELINTDALDLQDEFVSRWARLVLANDVWWDRVESFEKTAQTETGYDLTVPLFETFMAVDGVVLSNTMAGFVPLSSEAVEEAKKMFPSQNLFSPTTGKVMYTPSQEALLGLHQLSAWGKKVNKTFESVAALKAAESRGEIHRNDVVGLKGAQGPTTLGRVLIAETMPAGFTKNPVILHDPNFIINKSVLGKDMASVLAKSHAPHFAKTIDALKDLGNEQSFRYGSSISMEDFAPTKSRKLIFDQAKKMADEARRTIKDSKALDAKIVDIYQGVTEHLDAATKKELQGGSSGLARMVYSGSRGKAEQLRQMVAAPLLMQDGENRTVPHPITSSYAEGLSPADYFISQHGARKGTLQRAKGTAEPGGLSKDLINTTMNTLIVSKDCGTKEGISMPLSHEDLHDRHLANEVKFKGGSFAAGTLLTPPVVAVLQKHLGVGHTVQVRSPLRCAHGNGICAKCFGLNENGMLHQEGVNIGVVAAQALGEPATQLAMDAFHSGGLATGRGAGSVDKFTRLENLLHLPVELRDSATIAHQAGRIERIEQAKGAGGLSVFIQGKKHYVPHHLDTKTLKVGQEVKKGDKLSHGVTNPHDLLSSTKNIHAVQSYLTSALYDGAGETDGLYKNEGVRRRNVEVAVRSLTNLTKIDHPGAADLHRGDEVPLSMVNELNQSLSEKDKIHHTPFLKGVNQIPLTISTDWLARLNYQRLHNTLQHAAQQGWKSDLHGTHPIPGMIVGNEFGKAPPGKPSHHY